MTEKTTDNTEYTATFTLRQTGKDGKLFSSVVMEPRVKFNDDDFPVSFEIMSELMTYYLYMIGMIDKQGNIIDEEKFHDQVEVNVSPLASRYN